MPIFLGIGKVADQSPPSPDICQTPPANPPKTTGDQWGTWGFRCSRIWKNSLRTSDISCEACWFACRPSSRRRCGNWETICHLIVEKHWETIVTIVSREQRGIIHAVTWCWSMFDHGMQGLLPSFLKQACSHDHLNIHWFRPLGDTPSRCRYVVLSCFLPHFFLACFHIFFCAAFLFPPHVVGFPDHPRIGWRGTFAGKTCYFLVTTMVSYELSQWSNPNSHHS